MLSPLYGPREAFSLSESDLSDGRVAKELGG